VNDPSEAPLAKPLSAFASTTEAALAEAKILTKVRVGFAFAILLTCLLSFFSWWMAERATDDAARVAHTHEVSTVLEATLRHLVDVETGGRGFALTGHASFLEPYETGKSAIGQDLHRLRLLVADNTVQTQRLDILEAEANARIAASTDIVTSRQNTGALPSPSQFERGKPLMDAVRATIAEMEDEEKRLLEQRTGRARAAQHFNLSLIGLGALSGVIFLFVAGATVSREIGISARAGAQVISLNADLERRVEQRTAALQSEIAARVETDAKLRASEEMFRMLLDGIKDYAVYMLDAEGRVASWNSGAAGIKGYDAEEIIGKNVSCFYTDADRDRNLPQETLQEASQSGRFEGQGWRVRKDGSKFWAHAVITPLREANGALRGYSKVVRDITDRKQAEDELRKQAALLELAHDAILVRDLQSRVVFWNRGAEHLYGPSVEEATGRVTHELLQTKFPIPLADIEAILATKGDWEGELRHITRQGTEVIVASRWSIQRDEFGAPAAILEINRDITDRKRAEAALSESEGRVAGIIQSAMDSIITVDEEQRIVLFNSAAERVFLCPAAEALGQSITRFIPQRFHGAHADHVRRFGKTGVTNRAMGPKSVLWAVRADGQEFPIEAFSPHLDV
jgi:PAS domain S-box-containing protein